MSLLDEGLRRPSVDSGVSLHDLDYGEVVDPHALGLTGYSFGEVWAPHSLLVSQEVPPLILTPHDIRVLQAEKEAFQREGHDLGLAWLSSDHAVDPGYLAGRITGGRSDVRHNNGEDPFPIANLTHNHRDGGWFSFRLSDQPEMMGRTVATAENALQGTGRRLPTLSEFLLMALVIHDVKPQSHQSPSIGWPDVGYGIRTIVSGSSIPQGDGSGQLIGARFHPIKNLQLVPLVSSDVRYPDVGVRPIRPLPERKMPAKG